MDDGVLGEQLFGLFSVVLDRRRLVRKELRAQLFGVLRDGGPELWIGGYVPKSFERTGRHAAAWIAGGLPPDAFAESAAGVRQAWKAHGREGEPRLAGLAYFALGEDACEHADRDLKHYYAWLGEETANMIAGSAIVSPETAQQYKEGFAQAGCRAWAKQIVERSGRRTGIHQCGHRIDQAGIGRLRRQFVGSVHTLIHPLAMS